MSIDHGGLIGAIASGFMHSVCVKFDIMMRERYWEDLLTCGQLRGGYILPCPLWADDLEMENDPLLGVKQIGGHTANRSCRQLDLIVIERAARLLSLAVPSAPKLGSATPSATVTVACRWLREWRFKACAHQ
jgi:hypothetical protein